MKIWKYFPKFAASVVAVLALTAAWTVPALADDSAPPPAESPAAGPEGLAEGPASEPAAPEGTGPEPLAESPGSNELGAANEGGQAIPLATEQAATPIEVVDPIWCPTGVVPNPANPACSLDYPNLATVVSTQNPTMSGVIWIEAGLDTSPLGTITINGATNWFNADTFALTINGGWSGFAGSTALNPLTPSVIPQTLQIWNWNNTITLNNITIMGASTGTYALEVETTKNIVLNNVAVVDNAVNGAWLSNENAGANTGTVTISASAFNENAGFGLVVHSDRLITLKNVSANGNVESGAELDNSTALTAQPVTLVSVNTFSFNGWSGLTVHSQGAITLSNVSAIYNATEYGAFLDNCDFDDVDWCNQAFVAPVTLKGTSNFSNNGRDGLYVIGSGAITVNNLTANGNGTDDAEGRGAYLFNYGAHTAQPISVNGVNTLNDNAGAGLWIDAWGAVKANSLTANGNGHGVTCQLDPWPCDGANISTPYAFLLTGYGRFNANGDDGLYVYGGGAITISNLYADANDWSGVYLDNVDYFISPVNVSVAGTNVFTNNQYTGLTVWSMGSVTLNNITASYNGLAGDPDDGDGVYVDNCLDDLDVCDTLSAKPVTLNGTNIFNDNLQSGLYVSSRGAIKVNNLTANQNGDRGAYLDNDWDGAFGTIMVTGYASASDNGDDGLTIWSTGAITVSNVTANFNGDEGARLDNSDWGLTPQNVTLLGSNQFNWNYQSGLVVDSYGSITTNNLTANYNGDLSAVSPEGSGVILTNDWWGTLAKPVLMNGINTFIGNYDDGLWVVSLGAITVKQVMASENGINGAYLDNQWDFLNQPVTIAGTANTFNGNGAIGLEVYSNGNIIMANLTANGNIGNTAGGSDEAGGVYLYNYSLTTTPVNVTLTGFNTFSGNGDDIAFTGSGLMVFSDGAITISNLLANDNQDYGADLENDVSLPKPITLTGFATFVNNGLAGLYFDTNGAASITQLRADWNGDDGVFGTSTGAITITCGSMLMNGESGYQLSGSLITLKGVNTWGNTNPDVPLYPAAGLVITRLCPLL